MPRFDHSIDPDDEHGGDDGTGEGWGTPEDLAAVVEHVRATPPGGVDPWGLDEGQPLPRAARRERKWTN